MEEISFHKTRVYIKPRIVIVMRLSLINVESLTQQRANVIITMTHSPDDKINRIDFMYSIVQQLHFNLLSTNLIGKNACITFNKSITHHANYYMLPPPTTAGHS